MRQSVSSLCLLCYDKPFLNLLEIQECTLHQRHFLAWYQNQGVLKLILNANVKATLARMYSIFLFCNLFCIHTWHRGTQIAFIVSVNGEYSSTDGVALFCIFPFSLVWSYKPLWLISCSCYLWYHNYHFPISDMDNYVTGRISFIHSFIRGACAKQHSKVLALALSFCLQVIYGSRWIGQVRRRVDKSMLLVWNHLWRLF